MKTSLQPNRLAALLLCLGLLALAPGRVAALGGRYIDITTSGYAGSAPLTNFPLLVRLSTEITGFNYTLCQTNGADFVFQDADENVLKHEIDTWNTNDASFIWVCVPELTNNTRVRLVFGDPGMVAPAFTTNGTVWADGYRAVWHMDDGTANNNILDSTTNRFGGVKQAANSPAETDAVVGKGQQFASNYINLTGLTDASAPRTISMWIKGSSSAANQFVFDVETGRFLIGWGSGTAGQIGLYRTSWGNFGATPSLNVWHHLAVCCGADARLYVDGVPYGAQLSYSGVGFANKVALGSRYSIDNNYFAGLLDEVRVSSVLRPPDWIAASYSNMVPDSAFNAYSPLGTLGPSLRIVGRPVEYGVADPVYGLHEGLENGHTYTCSVSRVWDVAEGFRYICTGWKRYSIARGTFQETLLGEGTTNELVYIHTDLERLEWHFARQGVRVATSATEGGSVEVSPESESGFYATNSTVTITATEQDGYEFWHWVGDVPSGKSLDNPLTLTVNEPHVITAIFREQDSGKIIYASPTGSAANSGIDAAHPKTLESAFAIVEEDYTIILAPGDYTLWDYAGLVISNGVTVVGSDDPSQTVIHAMPAAPGYTGSRLGLTLTNSCITGVTFSDCYAASSTAGQILNAQSESLVTNCIIGDATVNKADSGTVINLSGTARITHSIIRNITKGYQNGWTGNSDFITLNGSSEITDSVVSNNTIHVVAGAAVKLNGASSALRRTLVAGNRQKPAEYVTCAAGVYAGAGVVEDSVISGNVLEGGTGPSRSANGLLATGSTVVRRCNISGNTGAANSAGGVFATSSAILENIIVSGNETSHGSGSGGIHIEGNAALIHATIYGNKATARTTGHGLRLSASNSKAYNTISYGNGLDDARFTTGNLEKSAGMITHSLVSNADEAALGSAGMLHGDPLFTDAEAGEFTLHLTSPCVDAGADLAGTAYKLYGTNDFNQVKRPQLTAPDMGAYELVPSGELEADLAVSEDPTTTGRSVKFTAVALPADGIASYSWTFTAPDGTQTSESTATNTITHAFDVCGVATTEVTVAWSGGGSATARVVSHVAARVAYADPDGANVWPYDTAAKAATNVQEAIATVYAETAAPGRVYLAPGTYTTANGQPVGESYMFSLARPIGLIGCGAHPADTVLDGMDARRVLSLGHAQAVVTNILVANAKNMCTAATIGFAVHNAGGTVTDCIVTNCVSFNIYSAECMVYMSSGIIENTDLCGHRQAARVYNDAGVPVYITGGTMRHCRVFNNRFCDRSRSGAVTLDGATALMEDCEITGNTGLNPEYSSFAAGGVSIRNGATMRRCLVANNVRDGGASYRNAGGVNANGGAPIIDSCIITNNSAGDTGTWGFASGGVFLGSAATLRNCLIAGNTSSQIYADRAAGGVRIDNAGARLVNCTIVGNTSPNVPTNGAIRMTAGSITNCIVWGNGTLKSGAWITAPILVYGGTVGYTCNEELIEGVGNTTQAPVFSNPAAGDYSLKRFHPELCRVAPPVEGITTDILGRPRTGRKLDLGAYAYTGNIGLVVLLR